MKPERVSIAEAARMLGVPKQHLRIGLQRGRYKFGEAWYGLQHGLTGWKGWGYDA